MALLPLTPKASISRYLAPITSIIDIMLLWSSLRANLDLGCVLLRSCRQYCCYPFTFNLDWNVNWMLLQRKKIFNGFFILVYVMARKRIASLDAGCFIDLNVLRCAGGLCFIWTFVIFYIYWFVRNRAQKYTIIIHHGSRGYNISICETIIHIFP